MLPFIWRWYSNKVFFSELKAVRNHFIMSRVKKLFFAVLLEVFNGSRITKFDSYEECLKNDLNSLANVDHLPIVSHVNTKQLHVEEVAEVIQETHQKP